MTCKEFLDHMEAQIRPGTRGAPVRREKFNFLREKHREHQKHLDYTCIWSGRHIVSPWNEKHPDHQALVMHRHGCASTDTYFLERALQTTSWRRDAFISHKKYAAFLAAMSFEERYQYYVKNVMGDKYYQQTAALCVTWDNEHREHFPREEAGYFAELYRARREDRVADDGSIIFYAASTEWEKYGKRSYPRVVDRRLERRVFTSTGTETWVIRYLDEGERVEAALDKEIPGRVERRKIPVPVAMDTMKMSPFVCIGVPLRKV